MSQNFPVSDWQHTIILGAGHGIGLALVQSILKENPNAIIYATYHNPSRADDLIELSQKHPDKLKVQQIDPLKEDEVEDYINQIKADIDNLDVFINSIGFLHDDTIGPEKSLDDIDIEQLTTYFQINSMITPLWAKHLKVLFSHQKPSIFTTLSAMVGSITDNKMGGWYGYRASKCALNMFIKNIAIEYQRNQLKTLVCAIHPGTTKTDLSSPFLGQIKHTVWETEDTAKHIIEVLEGLPQHGTGVFMNWDNTPIPW